LVDPELAEKLNLRYIFVEDLMEILKKESDDFASATNAKSLAMMQFSSGTTRAPKSVEYHHGAITVSGVTMKFGNGIAPDDVYFCPSSPAWGHGIWFGTITPLIFGIAVGTFSGKFNVEKCLEALEEWKVTNMAAISSHYRLILGSEEADKYDLKLEKIVYTGEPMPIELAEAIKRRFGNFPGV